MCKTWPEFSFKTLKKCGLPHSSLFRYFQVCHFLQHHDPNMSSPSGLDELLKIPFDCKRLILRIGECIASFKSITLAKIRAGWADEMGEDLEDGTWESALLRVNNSTSCAKLSIIYIASTTPKQDWLKYILTQMQPATSVKTLLLT